MQKQALKQSSSTDNFRFKINFAPALVKHAQELRKDAELIYSAAVPGTPEAFHNSNVRGMALSALGGLGIGGLMSLVKSISRPSIKELALPRSSTNLPLSLSFTQRKKKRRRKPEEEEDSAQHEKAAVGILGGPWAPVVNYPGMAALGLGGIGAGKSIGDYIAASIRKRRRKEQIQDAKDLYSEALAEQFAAGDQKPEEDEKSASADEGPGAEFDRLYDGLVKSGLDIWTQARGGYSAGSPKKPVQAATGKYLGFLALVALAAGLPTAHMAYKAVRKGPGQRGILGEAMRRRKAEQARRQPQAIHLTPGEVEEVEEDGPITGSAI